MNRERAEAHLRLLAEEELRRAAILVRDGAAGRPPGEAMCRASVTGTLAGSAALPDAVMASGGARGAGRGGTGLYPVHYRALVRLAVFLVRDTRAAEQVVQDAFAALRDGGPQPQDTDAALAYLRQAVVNRSRLVLRDRSVPGLRRHLVARVARVLAAVGALDDEVADQILEDFELALAARRAPAPGQAGPASWTQSPPVRPRPARPGARSGRVARLGQVIPVRGADMAGEVYLLSYARTASGPQFSLFARTSRVPGPAPAHPWPEIPLLEQFTATDDRGPGTG
jgi:DNA-directed RNA polymerase specialized sigma24 family protein